MVLWCNRRGSRGEKRGTGRVARDESLLLSPRHPTLGTRQPETFVSTNRLDAQFLRKTRELSDRLHAELLHNARPMGLYSALRRT